MISGESHYFLGRRYRLRLIHKEKGTAKIVLRNRSTIELQVPTEISTEQRERTLQRWYRQQLRALIPPLLEKWESVLGVEVADCRIKRKPIR